VPAGYNGTARTVTLVGEAYFDVPHDAARPFAVAAGPAVVHDLGTAFAVRRDDDGRVAVAVTQGAVRLALATPAAADDPAAQPRLPRSSAQAPAATGGPIPRSPASAAGRDSGVVLRAGERGLVAPSATTGRDWSAARVAGPAVRVADDTAWTSGRLVFRDAPLPEVAGALRRWYGVELRVADPALAGRHLTATFHGEPLPDVLRVVGLALGARLERRGDTVVVRAPR
jgi:transmembrane sensor